MYWKLAVNWVRRLWQQMVLRSGVVTMAVLAIVVLGLALGWHAHMKGRFAQFKAGLKRSDMPHGPATPRPGGQEPLVLERSAIEGGTVPEFLSATLLPGRGMNVLQITASLPNKGVVKLLDAPSLEDASLSMTGTGGDANGAVSLKMGSAIEAPWAGDIFGAASEDGVTTAWRGTSLRLPSQPRNGMAVATGGLLLKQQASLSKTNIMPDGGEAEASYEMGGFEGRWPSEMRVSTTTQLSAHALEMRISATNTGKDPQPVGIGWRPRFAILGNRSKMVLRLPSMMREEIRDPQSGIPTGKLLPVDGTRYDFSQRTGAALDNLNLDDTFVHLRQAPLDTGPVVELRDPENNYGLRITMLSASIKAVHVQSGADGKSILLEPRFNYDDPFGREWPKEEDTGMMVLRPGQSVQWRIRLEIFTPPSTTSDQP